MSVIEEEAVRRTDIGEIRKILDKRLRGLTLAAHYWKIANVSDRSLRMEFAKELYTYQMFSLNQLAKIVRLNVGTISRVMKKNAAGGAMEPSTLLALAHLRKHYLTTGTLYMPMVNQIVSEGTNLSTVCRLVGTSNGHYYRKMKEQA